MRKRSGSVSSSDGILRNAGGIGLSDAVLSPIPNDDAATLTGIDYRNKRIFEDIREDVLDAIKKFGDRYDIRHMGRSPRHAIFALSPDSIAIYEQLVKDFADRPEYSVRIDEPPQIWNSPIETVMIYREARPAPTTRQYLKTIWKYVAVACTCVMYLRYIGTAPGP